MIHRPALDRQHSTRQRLLGGFVLLSMALHAPLLLHHSAAERSTPATLTVVLNQPLPLPEVAMEAEMGSDSNSPPPSARHSVAPTPAAPAVTPASAPATTASAVEQPAEDSPPLTPAAVQEIESDPISTDPISTPATEPSAETVAARINLALAQHFRYPVLAVRRGWHGTVLLGLRVSCDGHIEAIHVAQSSGHALLDRAALDALQQVRKIALESGPLRAALDLQLPVIYHLEES